MVEPIYAVIEDFYNEEELKLVWRELEFIRHKMQIPELTSTAVTNGKSLKKAKGVFLNQVFALDILLNCSS